MLDDTVRLVEQARAWLDYRPAPSVWVVDEDVAERLREVMA